MLVMDTGQSRGDDEAHTERRQPESSTALHHKVIHYRVIRTLGVKINYGRENFI